MRVTLLSTSQFGYQPRGLAKTISDATHLRGRGVVRLGARLAHVHVVALRDAPDDLACADIRGRAVIRRWHFLYI